jgi:hypothetical protein
MNQRPNSADEKGKEKQRTAKAQIADKISYIAKTSRRPVNDVWAELVAPVVQEAFDAVGASPAKPLAGKG